ncbi:MAG TPA: hypothetical protein ENJ82_06320, partial [Bacteroidetes bacterium]|nr:hypothetical protein [Bacteroidota bacterium]
MKENDVKHFIQRYTFDVDVDDKSDAKPVQDRLSVLFHNRITAILSNVFDEFDNPAYITKIDKLEIDLGEISDASLEDEFIARFERQLRAILGDMVQRIEQQGLSTSSTASRVPLTPAKIEIIGFFLEHGRMPSGAEAFRQGAEKMLLELIELNPKAIVATLAKALAKKPAAALRIVRQFSRQTLEMLFKAAVPHKLFYVRAQEKEISEAVVKITGYFLSRVREETLVAIVRYIFSSEKVDFSPQKFRKAVAKSMAKALGSAILPAFETETSGQKARTGEAVGKLAEYRAVLVKLFRKPGAGVSVSEVVEAWEYLLREEPAYLRKILVDYALSVEAMAGLIAYLPIEAVRLLVRTMFPQDAPKVLEVAVAVIAAHSSLAQGKGGSEAFVTLVYASIVHQIVQKGAGITRQVTVAAQLKKDLAKVSTVPTALIADWEAFDIPGAITSEQKREAERKIAAEKAEKEAAKQLEEQERDTRKEEEEQLAKEKEASRLAEEAAEALVAEEKLRAAEKEKEVAEKEILAEKEEELKKEKAEAELQEAEEAEAEAETEAAEAEAEAETEAEAAEKAAKEEEERRKTAEKLEEEEPQDEELLGEMDESEGREEEKKKGAVTEESEESDPRTKDSEAHKEEEQSELAKEVDHADEVAYEKDEHLDEESAASPDSEEGEGEVDDPFRPRYPKRKAEPVGFESLATVEGSIEFIFYYFRHGKQPWWASNVRQRKVGPLLADVIKDRPESLVKAAKVLIEQSPRSEYSQIITRIIQELDELVLMRFMEKMAPETIGFMVTVARALAVFYDAKWREIDTPSHLGNRNAFAWFYSIKYVFEYLSSNQRPAEMLAYVLTKVAKDIQFPPREFIQEMEALATEAIAEGEHRFGPFKTMLPQADQTFNIAEPSLHPGEAKALEAAQKAVEEARKAAVLEAEKRAKDEALEVERKEQAVAKQKAEEAISA